MDPIYLHRLALRLGMPVGEMCERMSAHELCVLWPAYFEVEERMAEREAAKEQGPRPV
jgi:hypothetical protein